MHGFGALGVRSLTMASRTQDPAKGQRVKLEVVVDQQENGAALYQTSILCSTQFSQLRQPLARGLMNAGSCDSIIATIAFDC